MTGSWRAREPRTALLFVVPLLVSMVAITLVPVGYSVYIAFTNHNAIHFFQWDWIGLENFQRLLAGSLRQEFVTLLMWSLTFALASVASSYSVGLFLALVLNNPKLKRRNLYRTLLIIPWALPASLTILCWAVILNSRWGPLNVFLGSIGLPAVPWLSDPAWAKASVLLVNLWLFMPFMMTVNLGALQSIEPELYEVAEIDGAGRLQRLRFITLPLLRNAVTPLLVAAFAGEFNTFNVIYLLTGGNPPMSGGRRIGATDNLITYTYSLLASGQKYGLAAACGVIIFLIVAPMTALNFYLTGAFRKEE